MYLCIVCVCVCALIPVEMDPQIAQIVGEQVLSVIQREEERIDAEIKRLGKARRKKTPEI